MGAAVEVDAEAKGATGDRGGTEEIAASRHNHGW
jgi:hypothetical protein